MEQHEIRADRGEGQEDEDEEPVHVTCAAFEDRAREHNVYDVQPFYKSKTFAEHRYRVDEQVGRIMLEAGGVGG